MNVYDRNKLIKAIRGDSSKRGSLSKMEGNSSNL